MLTKENIPTRATGGERREERERESTAIFQLRRVHCQGREIPSVQMMSFLFYIYSCKPVSQSCVVAKRTKFWRVTGQSNLAEKGLAATEASRKVWFSFSHNCTLDNGAVFYSARQNFSLLANAHDYNTGIVAACLTSKK